MHGTSHQKIPGRTAPYQPHAPFHSGRRVRLAVLLAFLTPLQPLRAGDAWPRTIAAPVPVEGRRLLAYEVPVGDATEPSTRLHSLCVSDERGQRLATFAGDDLRNRMVSARPLPASGSDAGHEKTETVAFIEVVLPPGEHPKALHHDFDCDGAPVPPGRAGSGVARSIEERAPVVLGPPLGAGTWVAVHAPDWNNGHRRVFYSDNGRVRLPGRYAIDFVGVDGHGRTTAGNPDHPSEAIGYGRQVLAVADATVVRVRDGVGESDSIQHNPAHGPDRAAGNHVVLDLGHGRYAVYEHLKPGSVTVRPGELVRRGQAIGRLGFSGDSTGPHLHFHVADAADPLRAEGLPFAFTRFRLRGHYLDIGELGKARWNDRDRRLSAERSGEWPAYNAVIEF